MDLKVIKKGEEWYDLSILVGRSDDADKVRCNVCMYVCKTGSIGVVVRSWADGGIELAGQ